MGKPWDMPSTGSTKGAAALGTFALLLFLFAQPIAATPSQPRIRVLILDGFSNHDWHQTTALLRGILDASELFTVSVSTAPSTTASPGWEQWRGPAKRTRVLSYGYDQHTRMNWPME